MTITLQAVNELIASLESAGEPSIREQKFLKLAKEFRICSASLDTAIKTGNVLADQNAQLAAENMALKSFGDKLCEMHNALNGEGTGIQGRAEVACQQVALEAAMEEFDTIETPATDAYLAGIKADGVEEFLKGSQLPYQIATVLADYDNADDETLLHVIWSGQPPEPEGDVWHLEYVSRGNAIVREVLKQLREGGDK
ncbi:hypothetical protein [Klebsiella quasipneumoniae]|uniref:hypothetical protein n=1 Tax=Klebsiella quasipneumoniae TaxID=1463165 RepID=UPI002169872C|nr:hypothetical protein [Klebsiella quasipneumoniae]MCS4387285.1 hypothetical protein [Klebsiella quasipneumoniae subsp. similipneumoniae]MCS4414033.1 hypothetical protein [Klebsiella quasipneumoniae subsp. similipneumoniae]